jgi:hypothetical protein
MTTRNRLLPRASSRLREAGWLLCARLSGFEGDLVALGHLCALHLTIHDDVSGGGFGEEEIIGRAVDFVGEAQDAAAGLGNACADDEFIVIVCGRFVPARGLHDRYVNPVVSLHRFVVEPHSADEFDAPYFKPDKVVGVVDDAHLIGLGVAHANAGF